jgi:hypothetical protein
MTRIPVHDHLKTTFTGKDRSREQMIRKPLRRSGTALAACV